MNKKIRTRFAPSPTGYLHIGSLRTAFYNYLFAKHNDGVFILRIEDTDRSRYVEGSIENLIKILNNMGLSYEEGVTLDKDGKLAHKGNFGPYMQSQRLDIYRKYVDELVKNDHAYYCFCSQERLEQMRKDQQANKMAPMYDGKCKKLSKDEINALIAKKTPYVIRMKVPREGVTEFEDIIYGKISVQNNTIDDQVLLKSDGFPTYHMANIVDDHLMEITHVLRAEEWLPSTPKHILLYKAMGWTPPIFIHLPLLLNPTGGKLSKRQGDVSVENYLEKGYLKEALLNFVLLLGWNPKTDEEVFSPDEIIKRFDVSGINHTGAVFDVKKLDWLNGVYIRKTELGELTKLCIPYLVKANYIDEIKNEKIKDQNDNSKFKIIDTNEVIDLDHLKKIVALEQERMKMLSEIGELVKFMFRDKLEYEKGLLAWKKMTLENAKINLGIALEELAKLDESEFSRENIEKKLRSAMEEKNIKAGEILWPLRASLTGLQASPGPFEVAEALGRSKTLKRISEAMEKIG
ncbi:MAG: glutamate--tRNA ligase [Candidatus Paceibacterota bacterium]|jgi:glutamyl-tRNA synthetase